MLGEVEMKVTEILALGDRRSIRSAFLSKPPFLTAVQQQASSRTALPSSRGMGGLEECWEPSCHLQ